jgi:putative transposase
MEGYFHVWFRTKGRKEVLEGDVEQDVKDAIRAAAAGCGVDLMEMETAFDHVHLLLRLQDRQTLSWAMHRLKGASARAVLSRSPELTLHSERRHLWQRGYGWRRVTPDEVRTMRRYIQTQRDRPHRSY